MVQDLVLTSFRMVGAVGATRKIHFEVKFKIKLIKYSLASSLEEGLVLVSSSSLAGEEGAKEC